VEERLDDPDPPVIRAADQPISDIRVYVTGAVQNPGVYPLAEDSRWGDAITAAGGFAPDANPEAVNLARRVQDEDHIVVPRAGQAVAAGVSQGPLLNINTASESDLMSLPGIGEERARRIVSSRLQVGLFASTEDLLARELVPESVFEDIVAFITVAP
jgi:competence protein ComEA